MRSPHRLAPLALLAAIGCGSNPSSSGPTADAAPSADGSPMGADAAPATLDELLAALRADPEAAMQAQSEAGGWPAPVDGGYLFVSLDPALTLVAGDHDDWAGTPMTADDGFSWIVLDVAAGNRYKLTDTSTFAADPWSRAYQYDEFGRMSMVPGDGAHLERYFNVTDGTVGPRTVRVWLPAEPPTHVLYTHDGQNLFDPGAPFGGWKLDQTAPDAMMIVGIDNTAARMDDYTHVTDDIGGGPIGGDGAAYAAFVNGTVRALIADKYGEPDKVGTMGSSLGGLIALYIADQYPDEYDFAASLSGTVGWGSIGAGVHNQTIIERYAAAGHRGAAIYIDSGGNSTACADSDNDGIEDDDATASDNYCENRQLEATLRDAGYVQDTDMWHWWEPDAQHNEAAWAARVFRPLGLFADL